MGIDYDKITKTKTILIVDSEVSVRDAVKSFLKDKFKAVYIAEDGKEGLKLYSKYHPNILVTDIKVPFINGLELISKIKKVDKAIKVIILSATAETKVFMKAIDFGVNEYIPKPLSQQNLLITIHKVIAKTMEEDKIRFHCKLMQNAIESEKSLILVKSPKNILFVNRAFLEFFSVKDLTQFKNSKKDISHYFISSSKRLNSENWEELLSEVEYGERVKILDKFSRERIFIINSNRVSNFSREYVISLTDITKDAKKAEELSHYDNLTKTLVKEYFQEEAKYIINDSLEKERAISLMLIYIDNFTNINKKYGNTIGDIVLSEIISTIKSKLKEPQMIGRIAGAQFGILMPDFNIKDSIDLARELKSAIGKLEIVEIEDRVTLSFAISSLKNSDNYESIVGRVEKLLFKMINQSENKIGYNPKELEQI